MEVIIFCVALIFYLLLFKFWLQKDTGWAYGGIRKPARPMQRQAERDEFIEKVG